MLPAIQGTCFIPKARHEAMSSQRLRASPAGKKKAHSSRLAQEACPGMQRLQECRGLLSILRVTSRRRLLSSQQELLRAFATRLDGLLRAHYQQVHIRPSSGWDRPGSCTLHRPVGSPLPCCRCGEQLNVLNGLAAQFRTCLVDLSQGNPIANRLRQLEQMRLT